jgi:hypothetical protein
VTEGNGKSSVVMYADLLQGGGDGRNWRGFSGDMCRFCTGSGRRREIDRMQWCCVLVSYRVGETKGHGKFSVVICAGLV